MNDNVEIIRSNKGGLKLIHRGYMYTVHKKRQGGGIRWRCTQRSLHCKGSISTGNGPPTVNMPHNHIPDPHSVALARCRQIEEFPDIASMLETECEDVKDGITGQQRMYAPLVQIPCSETALQTQPLSPTKLKVTRQANNKFYSNKSTSQLPSEEVCLRWNSHHSNMQNSFPKLLEKEQYVDVTLMAEGRVLKCHRMILSSCSAYFEDVLSGITPTQHPVIILKSIPFWILKALIDFMYAGEVNIDQNKLPELLDVAELLKIKGLAGKNNSDSEPKIKEESKEHESTKGNEMTSINCKPANSLITSMVTPKVEEMPISDPLELLQPKFPEDPTIKSKDKCLPKKLFVKKIRKRKSSDDEAVRSSPPLFPMRRGTRSRPNVKVPRYYDYEDIVKPSTSDSQPYSPGVTIKTEPPDVDDNEASYSGDNTFHIESPKVTIKPKHKTEKSDELKPEQLYKIKIKCLASLSENSKPDLVDNRKGEEIESPGKLVDPLEIDSDCRNNDILNALEIIKIDVNVHNEQQALNNSKCLDKVSPVEIINTDKSVEISKKDVEEN